MALSIERVASPSSDAQMTPDFDQAISPKEFVAMYGDKEYKVSETDNTHRLSLSCVSSKGKLTSALAGPSLQKVYDETPLDKEFQLPSNTLCVPVFEGNVLNHWTMYLQSEITLKTCERRAISQIF